ncbi:MAG: [FeFe] hydrogenase H-cluster radical SAM maturase HydE [Candidatus Cloacimonas sp.]
MRPDKKELMELLSTKGEENLASLYKRAYEIKKQFVGTTVYLRGLIELSNICSKNCYYCGIRSGNKEVNRYQISFQEAMEEVKLCIDFHYGSIVIQAGEREDKPWIDFITKLVKSIKELSDNKLGITLSLGEQELEVYQQWFEAGAHRYLLRIETSNPELYKALHPANHSFAHRLNCLHLLRQCGYQVGTGVMTGLPGQTIEDLANDILFFSDEDIDMLGMGPFIPHHNTPFKNLIDSFNPTEALNLGLKMIAVCRITLQDVNIASTTALQALHPEGRELGLKAGANVLMPNITDTKYRKGYQLYEGKPGLNETAIQFQKELEKHIYAIGETIGYDKWGDSHHFFKRKNEKTL